MEKKGRGREGDASVDGRRVVIRMVVVVVVRSSSGSSK